MLIAHRYAYQYKCPQAYYFDGIYLVGTRFHATSRDHIKQQDCYADVFFIHKDDMDLPYWIDLLIVEGLNRLRAELAGALSLGEYRRYFRYYDGRPYWVDQEGNDFWDHPDGYTRSFRNEQWWWDLGNQAPVQDTPKLE